MPPEGPNKSEELLKRYAKERREQTPKLSLHPATRRLLQGEVRREFGQESRAEQRGWAVWFGLLRGRLAISTAVGVVAVAGVCIWWNNQKPPSLEMASADSSANEFAEPASRDIDEVKLQAKKEISGTAVTAPVQLGSESRRLALAPAAPSAIQPELKAKLQTASPAEASPTEQSTFAFNGGFALSKTPMPSTNLIAFGATAAPGSGTSLRVASSTVDFGTTLTGRIVTTQANLAVAYDRPTDGLALAQRGNSPSVATLGDTTVKGVSKLAEAETLATEPALVAARPDSGAIDRARRGGMEVQAPTGQPPATAAPLSRSLAESLTEEKRQLSSTARTRSELGSQRPESPEQLARFYRQSAAPTDEYSKQKALRDLDRSAAGAAVLSSFSIEQTGNAVRVVDADGSVYDGKIEAPVVTEFDSDLSELYTERKDQSRQEKPVALRSAIAAPAEAYSFRAAGSNLTLRQYVVVNGRLTAGTNTSARRGTAGAAGGSLSRSTVTTTPSPKGGVISNRANAAPQPIFGGRYALATNQAAALEGTVTIGVTNQQWFRAVREPR